MSAETRMNNDAEHLRLLSIFHYIAGGVTALFALFPAIHLFMGIAMVTGRFDGGRIRRKRASSVGSSSSWPPP